MKKIIFLFVLALLTGTNLYAQNLWTTESNLNFTVQSNTKVSSAINENGIHIVYSRNGGIRYALVNSQGTVLKYDKVIESEGSGTDFANVTAVGTTVYAIYYKNNDIKVARSTNLGDNWSASFSSRPLENTGCNKIVAYSDGSNIRITWSERRVNDPNNYDAHYIMFIPASTEWNSYKRVSENDGFGGENPDLAFNSEKVEVNYLSFYQPKNRERLSNGNWNNSESFPYVPTQVVGTKPFIIGNTLNSIYKASWSTISGSGAYIGHAYRNINDDDWTQNESTIETEFLNMYELYPHVLTSTTDGKMHLIYWDKNTRNWAHRYLTGESFSGIVAQIPIAFLSNTLIASSNDLFLVYSNNVDVPGNIKFRHYDAAPLTPSDFQLTNSGSPYYHPYLSWNAVNEPDVRIKNNGLRIERSIEVNGQWSSWSEIAAISGTSTTYTDGDIINATGGGNGRVKYRIRSYDNGGNFSPYTSEIIIRYGISMEKEGVLNTINIVDYTLDQNYPNPFNPSTIITYQIKDRGFVSLKVYDMLGKEIADLVNETQETGEYSVNFNASNLPSGIYIYSLRVNDFVQNSKMTLLK